MRKLLLSLSALALLALPALAQHDRDRGGNRPGGAQPGAQSGTQAGPRTGGGFHPGPDRGAGQTRGPQVFRGGPRGTLGWGDFHHDNAPARITPHRQGQSFLPRPNNWRGNFGAFNPRNWQGGNWRHEYHGGRLGWWWVLGPDWYYFDQPVYPYPDLYTPYGLPLGWWYWCDPLQQYYPYVTWCPVAWESVMPRD